MPPREDTGAAMAGRANPSYPQAPRRETLQERLQAKAKQLRTVAARLELAADRMPNAPFLSDETELILTELIGPGLSQVGNW